MERNVVRTAHGKIRAYHLESDSPICGLAIFNPIVVGASRFYPAANGDDGKRRKLT